MDTSMLLTDTELAGLSPLAYASSLSHARRYHLLPSVRHQHWQHDSIQRAGFAPSYRPVHQLWDAHSLLAAPQTPRAHA